MDFGQGCPVKVLCGKKKAVGGDWGGRTGTSLFSLEGAIEIVGLDITEKLNTNLYKVDTTNKKGR